MTLHWEKEDETKELLLLPGLKAETDIEKGYYNAKIQPKSKHQNEIWTVVVKHISSPTAIHASPWLSAME